MYTLIASLPNNEKQLTTTSPVQKEETDSESPIYAEVKIVVLRISAFENFVFLRNLTE
jgi:hypothetical protein